VLQKSLPNIIKHINNSISLKRIPWSFMSWSIEQSRELYNISAWSDGYVDINESGHLCVNPHRSKTSSSVNLPELSQQLQDKGLSLPILVRFSDILKDRVTSLISAFDSAMQSSHYDANYTAVYPIKVNQQRRVIEDIIASSDEQVGLEAGSKPELLIVIAMARHGSTIICNGYKDREYIRLALIAKQLGFNIYIVIEKLSELDLIIECSNELKIKPLLGIRVRLSSIAKGNWQNTGGEKAKFGLHANQMIEAIDILKNNDLLDSLELLHFHIGSQISELEDFQNGLNEATRYFVQLNKMAAPINTIDIGGGLGVDYEGTNSSRFYSMDYNIKSYAATVIKTIQSICLEENLEVPSIITESGRAMTAHHAMLITNIIDIEAPLDFKSLQLEKENHDIINDLYALLKADELKDVNDLYQKNKDLYEQARHCFANGKLDIQQWALAEELYYSICNKCVGLIKEADHELLESLREKLSDKYFCNFSVFQTMPDSWAIDQVFPILPLQRLNEKPDKRCTIQDLTCDSDGRIDDYVDGEGIETSLPIHSLNKGESYLVGIFLLGAYQEILGDIHNLFGDPASVNVDIDNKGHITLNELDAGDTVSDLFQTIHIDPEKFCSQYKSLVQKCNINEKQKADYLRHLLEGLDGYTYLEEN
jgi:arginine decarboxylase